MPVNTIIYIGFILNFLSPNKDIINIMTAVMFKLIVLIFINGEPKKAIKRIVDAEDAISPTEEERSPFKIFKILFESLYLLKNLYKRRERIKPDRIHPNVDIIAPNIPAIRIPTKVEILMAKGPGVI